MSEQHTEQPDPRFEPRLFLVCWKLDNNLWARTECFDRTEAQKYASEGYAVVEYARGGFIHAENSTPL